jgi:hypothetical protein
VISPHGGDTGRMRRKMKTNAPEKALATTK